MKVAVLGSGAMGSLYGAAFSKNNEVWLVDKWQDQVDAINKNGLVLEFPDGPKTYYPKATTNPEEVGVVDLLIVFVKSTQTYQALKENSCLFDDHTVVLSLQNGFGNHEEMAKFIKPEKMVVGNTTSGSTIRVPGVLRGFSYGIEHIGTLIPDDSAAQFVAKAMKECGLNPEIGANVLQVIWGKVIVNCGINAIVAMLDRRNEFLALDKHGQYLSEVLVREAVYAANLDGCTFDADKEVANVQYICRDLSPKVRASMLQDVTFKRPTEIDTILGAVVKTAAKYGQEDKVPCTKFMVELIKAKEDTYLLPEWKEG